MTQTKFTVTGMSCDHCARAVTEEITKIQGVSDVAVDVTTGAVTVSSAQAISDAEVRAAVEEAGYELVAG